MSYCKLLLMGNLTRDPETRYAQSGTAVVQFGMAYNEKWDGGERTTFVDVTMFGKRGEAFARFHKKGDRAFVEGKLRLDQWEDKNGGGKRSKLYMVADSFEFVGQGKGSSEGPPAASGGAPASSGDGGDPWGASPEFDNSTPF